MRTDALTLTAEGSRAGAFWTLTKPGITAMVLVTAAVGYLIGGAFDLEIFSWMLLGTALAAAGGSALNMVMERDLDARMSRTASRPIPSGRVTAGEALGFGVALSIAGLAVLASAVNVASAFYAAATLGVYLYAYTPLKRVTSLCTVVGAVSGALPPVIGFAASRGDVAAEGWALFAILFLWQLPHFLAIAWMYREDYQRAGFPMLAAFDPDGAATGRQMVLWSAALTVASLLPATLGFAGTLYLAGALGLGAIFTGFGICFLVWRTAADARNVFMASVVYLPVLLALLSFARS